MKNLIRKVIKEVIAEACAGMTKEAMLDFLRMVKSELIETIREEIMSILKAKFLEVLFEKTIGKYIRQLNSLYKLLGRRLDLEDLDLDTNEEFLYEHYLREDEEIGEEEYDAMISANSNYLYGDDECIWEDEDEIDEFEDFQQSKSMFAFC